MNDLIKKVLAHYQIGPTIMTLIESGHINTTWVIKSTDEKKLILQKINSIFPAEIHKDIYATIQYLNTNGIMAPQIVKNIDGQLVTSLDGSTWRMQEYINGQNFELTPSEDHAFNASKSLAEMQNCLKNNQINTSKKIVGHDTIKCLKEFEHALLRHPNHSFIKNMHKIYLEIKAMLSSIPRMDSTSSQLCHGDPKLTNILFKHGNSAVRSWVDFDSIGPLNPLDELGDAIRSWCNPLSEDNPDSYLDVKFLSATLEGYLSKITTDNTCKRETIFFHTQRITLELAARFATDVLNESYFGWDNRRFERAATHNLMRTQGQLSLFYTIKKQKNIFN
jgi:Ser/Thr protein kinase RdoA (MazF antagonist)